MKRYFLSLSVLTLLLGISGTSTAQKIDGFDFGNRAGAAVRIADQLDYMTKKCLGQKNSLFLNQVDSVLRRINGRSAQLVKQNAARASGLSLEAINRLPIEEVDQVMRQYGGCGTPNYAIVFNQAMSSFESHMKYLANIAQMTERNAGRNLID